MEKAVLDVRMLLRTADTPAEGSSLLDFSARDFIGWSVKQPVRFVWRALPSGEEVHFAYALQAKLEGECSRCLGPAELPFSLDEERVFCLEELQGEYPEYPTVQDGVLDLEEYAYGELLLEAPSTLLCSETCEGLCSQCGQVRSACTCTNEPAGDARWDVLRQLLQEDADTNTP